MANEIERKFYCDPVRRVGKRLSVQRIEQAYLDDTGGTELRLRRPGNVLTLKNGRGLQRFEWEVILSSGEFEQLWPRTASRVGKVRERYAWKAHTLEVDRYEGRLEGLVVAEVEFASVEQARDFKLPPVLGPEVTWDPRFKNRALADGSEVPFGMDHGEWSYGVLPFVAGPKGPELIVVTTRRHDRWIVPKGQPEPGQTPQRVAVTEAREEAGLTGRVVGHPIVLPFTRETGTTNLLLFPFQVSRVADRFLEAGQRERRQIPLEEADSYGDVVRLGAKALLDMLGTVGS